MKTLAVDTALGACSVAIIAGGDALAHRCIPMLRGHAEALAPMVDQAMREAGLAFSALDRLGVTTGPGTFTGQRVGLAFMRGLRLALGRPLVGVTTLEAMAAAAAAESQAQLVAVLHEAKRGEVYAALYSGRETIIAAQVGEFDSVMRLIVSTARGRSGSELALAGTGAPPAAAWLEQQQMKTLLTSIRQPDALWVAHLSQTLPLVDGPVRPLYLRAPDAKLATAAIRTRAADAQDGALLAELYKVCLPGSWDNRFFEDVLAAPGGFAVIAEASGVDLGFVFGRAAADEAEILAVGVLPLYRRNGLARRLMQEAARAAVALGAKALFLEVATDNFPARALYEAYGMQAVGTRKNYYRAQDGGDAAVYRGSLESSDLGNGPKVA